MNSKEFDHNTGLGWQGRSHCHGRMSTMFALLHEMGGRNLVQIAYECSESVFLHQAKTIRRYGRIYCQDIGSYTLPSPNHHVVDTRLSERIVFPQATEARYLQWPGGRHWYAKVGDTDVEVDGEAKWSTKEAAERAVAKFLKEARHG
jgi:hypothetical protein